MMPYVRREFEIGDSRILLRFRLSLIKSLNYEASSLILESDVQMSTP